MSRCSRRSRVVSTLLAAVVAACTPARAAAPIIYQVEPVPEVIGCSGETCRDSTSHVVLTYLGVGGVLIEHRGRSLLAAPFFSNPPLRTVLTGVIRPDTLLIERLLPRAADGADAILVGHGHYDHLLDLPYIASKRVTRATIYGDRTVRNILLGDPTLKRQPQRLVAFDSGALASRDTLGRWTYTRDSTFRFMPVRGRHAPTLKLFTGPSMFADGSVDSPLDTLPTRAADWKLGTEISYLIDVLGRGTAAPLLRIYYEDAPNDPPRGFPPRALIAARGVDVAVLCAATATHVSDTPGALLDYLKPSYVVVAHWEDFFRPQTSPIQLNPFTETDAFMDALAHRLPPASRWSMPLPRTTLRFAPQRR
jgi:hypothetical protein